LAQRHRAGDSGKHRDARGGAPAADLADHGEATRVRHRNVQQQQVGLQPLRERDRRDAVLGFADQLDSVYRSQDQAHRVTHDGMVVGDQNPAASFHRSPHRPHTAIRFAGQIAKLG